MNDPGIALYAYLAGAITGALGAMVLFFYLIPTSQKDHHDQEDRDR